MTALHGPGDDAEALTRNEPPLTLEGLRALGQEARRIWLRGWMGRMGLANANQAAPWLSLTRQTVEKMLYPDRKVVSAVGDQTLHIAFLEEQRAMTVANGAPAAKRASRSGG